MTNFQAAITNFETQQRKAVVPDVRPGETVKVHYKIREGGKERVQIFEGLVIGTKATKSYQGSFTVRKVVDAIGVERTFPLHSPWVLKVERVKSGKVRRAKLNFVREYALSRRFKLKDKGVEGTTWEELDKQELGKQELGTSDLELDRRELGASDLELETEKPVPSPQSLVPSSAQSPVPAKAQFPVALSDSDLAKEDKASDNDPNVVSEQSARPDRGELGDESAGEEKIPDSETKLSD